MYLGSRGPNDLLFVEFIIWSVAQFILQNFYLTGRDLATNGLSGDLQGGWIGANAALGARINYKAILMSLII